MNKNTINKKIIYCTVIIGIIGMISVGLYRHHKTKRYNMLVTEASDNLKKSKYDEAIILFKEAMKYKDDLEIKNSMKLAEKLKTDKKNYEGNLKFTKEKKHNEVKQSQESMNKKRESYPQKSKNIEINSQTMNKNINKRINNQQAEEMIKNYIKSTSQEIANLKVEYDHDDVKLGIKYFVIHVYCVVEDHTATMGWYYVNKQNGKCYKWDLTEDSLIPLT
ncbi:hypothetical protein IRP63_01770 [Clostridium botulinum]|uniref:Uncharacterized protein n=1 Tax=Clostridium botulinum C/D str. DC5 TaxID=1443128 RepID=A0A0A0I4T0_CLOBO|nr:hypothetical protein [Clostridium botulinum]KGM95075.1 hypothetical protein Z956_05875 [Clostridium botulinum D str. CCUG 7971]KGM96404.1 hypothetical protein Z955_13095 [Clostridium botulinum C/D str. DC5]KOC49242.1 hypothetical protein ADU88_06465 [Clostridium botulinum]KOC50338.1 hypothetical protein ADU89_14525 [Clostridium botulinum]KOC53016.1 hypothetical protein ADU90_14055 [Clostridium botulinum]